MNRPPFDTRYRTRIVIDPKKYRERAYDIKTAQNAYREYWKKVREIRQPVNIREMELSHART
ncbi:MAG: hypothetical protein AAFY24_01955 [Pseudomonadota bacterium]